MKERYLEVTYRNGKPLAAYLYLHREPGDACTRTDAVAGGLVVDYRADGRAIGIEITSPSHVGLDELNRVLASLNETPLSQEEIRPLAAA